MVYIDLINSIHVVSSLNHKRDSFEPLSDAETTLDSHGIRNDA